ncbi:DUF2505 domain-containing protein [Demetria terragena]|uniref:DUF2505 domain-containing protein n=1 Tax=Demetria terragena TaxID=63959 RepID=UPI00036F3BB0|nr:DUF2505 domain-containing protein [Demetria terragena]
MKISETWSYDAPANQVWDMLIDPAFQERKCAASGALSYDTSIDGGAEKATIEVSREMPTDDLPSQVKRFLSGGLTVVETQAWEEADANGSRRGTITVLIKGTPAAMRGSLTLTADGETTHVAIDADLKAGIPLVGGQIEKAAAPAIVSGIRVEAREGQAYLTE